MEVTYLDWVRKADSHLARASAYTQPYRERKCRNEAHPIDDFLFTYYHFSLAKVETWHPSSGQVLLIDNSWNQESFSKQYPHFFKAPYRWEEAKNPGKQDPHSLSMDLALMTEKQRDFLSWIENMLIQTENRTPNFGCFGLHEWAMVYGGQEVRHEKSTALRLPQNEIDALVDSRPLCCSHFDAYRFFAPETVSMNRFSPTLATRPEHEQPACLHANMDLYKWAFKAMPWVGTDILWECFELALVGRELDMRASPYDLTKWGFDPIKVEALEGRLEYERQQRVLHEKAQILRAKLREEISSVLNAVNKVVGKSTRLIKDLT